MPLRAKVAECAAVHTQAEAKVADLKAMLCRFEADRQEVQYVRKGRVAGRDPPRQLAEAATLRPELL